MSCSTEMLDWLAQRGIPENTQSAYGGEHGIRRNLKNKTNKSAGYSGQTAPDWVPLGHAPTTLFNKLNRDQGFERNVSEGSGNSALSTAVSSMSVWSSSPGERSPSPVSSQIYFGSDTAVRVPQRGKGTGQRPCAPASAPSVKGVQHSSDPDTSVRRGHTKVLISGLPRKFTQRDWMVALKDAGFRPNTDFDSLYIPVDDKTGYNSGYCTMNFVNVSCTRAFTSAFHGRLLRHTEAKIAVRCFDFRMDDIISSGESQNLDIELCEGGIIRMTL